MRLHHLLVLSLVLFLLACQPAALPTVTILDGDTPVTVQTEARVPAVILSQAGVTLNPNDRIIVNGLVSAPEASIANLPATIQIRRAVTLTLITPTEQRQMRSAAWTVGEALAEAGYVLHAGDVFDVPLSAPLTEGLTISVAAPRLLTVSVDGQTVQVQTSAQTVGEALAEAGIPLIGQDYSRPGEHEALPSDGQVQVVRVSESVLLAQKPVPYESEFIASADVLLDQTQVLNPGSNGLMLQRIRVRYENGQEVSRATEEETMVRPPEKRVVGYGTKIEIKTATVDGVQIEYWRAVRLFATSFSPCRLGVAGLCSTRTASGLPLKKGVAGMKYNWYIQMRGQQFYIPGYGFAVLGDSGGPHPLGYPHIDLGYEDADYVGWAQWVTVYFLTPVPDSIVYILQ